MKHLVDLIRECDGASGGACVGNGGCNASTPSSTMGMGNPTTSSGDTPMNPQDAGRAHSKRERLNKKSKRKRTNEEE